MPEEQPIEPVVMFLVCGGEQYYASGGGYDVLTKTKDLEQAIKLASDLIGKYAVYEIVDWSDDRDDDQGFVIEWTHVVNGATGEIVRKIGKEPYGHGNPVLEIRET